LKIVDSNSAFIEDIFQKVSNLNVIYFQRSYHQFENKLGYETGIAINNDGVCIPFRIYKKWIFKFFQPLYPPTKDGIHLTEEKEKQFLEELCAALKKEGKVHRIMQSFIMDVFQSAPSSSVACKFGQLYLDIANGNEEDIFSQFQARYRSQIRSAAKDSLAVIKHGDTELNLCFQLYQELHQRQHMFHENINYFKLLQESLNKNELFFYTGYYNNIPQCSALVILKNKEAYYLFGGSIPKTNHPGIIKLMHWEIIKKVKSLGVEKYIWGGCRLSDVEGTKQQGMQEFKLRFGSQIKKGMLWKMDINLTYCRLYDFLVKLQHKLKGMPYKGDVIDYERNREVIL
jgi:hypothetical protein